MRELESGETVLQQSANSIRLGFIVKEAGGGEDGTYLMVYNCMGRRRQHDCVGAVLVKCNNLDWLAMCAGIVQTSCPWVSLRSTMDPGGHLGHRVVLRPSQQVDVEFLRGALNPSPAFIV